MNSEHSLPTEKVPNCRRKDETSFVIERMLELSDEQATALSLGGNGWPSTTESPLLESVLLVSCLLSETPNPTSRTSLP